MGTNICSEQQQHKFHHSHQLYNLTKKSIREIDIPPRKLLSRLSAAAAANGGGVDMFVDSPKSVENTLLSKFLPYNNVDSDDDSDPYSSDHFRIYEFKVRKCTRSRSHDWTDCPFAHPGEKARRRDPRRFHYSGTVCSEFRKGHCSKGDNCEFSHGVFECWLHPSRYRTEACKDGKNCKRKVCFFAHSTRQLRILSDGGEDSASPPRNSSSLAHCCACCHSINPSPTSTLLNMSQFTSSPVSSPVSPPEFLNSRYGDRFSGIEARGVPEFNNNIGGMSYKDALTELMSSLDAMNVNENEFCGTHSGGRNANLPWVDVNFCADEIPPQFVMSPSTPSPRPGPGISKFPSGASKFFHGRNLMQESGYNNESNSGGPDLGWVNDLLT
ncbi:hypothetical protein ACJIZ3_010709 [Penstemon smallii]|uniref:C3H1-type domain-containing protein n=1 Tax=Penstemon smallii TaxID=265156 RepID=A0ABD3UKR3_9LAMI